MKYLFKVNNKDTRTKMHVLFFWLWTCFMQCEKRLHHVHTSMLIVSYKGKNTAINLLLIKWTLEQCYLYRCRVYDIDL